MRGTKTENWASGGGAARDFRRFLELEAAADPGADDGNIDVRQRRELNEFELAAQKNILRHRPIKAHADGKAVQQRAVLSGAV